MTFLNNVNLVNMNKRGSLSDLIYVMVIFLTVGLAIIIGKQVFMEINDAGFMEDYPKARNIMLNSEERTLPLFDVIFLAVIIAGFLGTLFLAFQLRTSPLFFWLGFLFLIIVVLLAGVFSNVYQEISDQPAFADAMASDVTFMDTTMDNLPIVLTVIGAVVLIVLYGLARWQMEAQL